MKNVIIVGASGYGKLVADVVLNNGDNVLGFLDDAPQCDEFFHRPVLGTSQDYAKYKDAEFCIAIGNATVRERIATMMEGVKWYTAIHPKAVISPYDVAIGEGSVVLPGAVIDPGVTIGKHTLVNCNAVVAHDCNVGDYCHISVGTNIAGTVNIGNRTWVGIGASVSNNINICGDCMIGAGAVVVKDITEAGTYVGVPAHKLGGVILGDKLRFPRLFYLQDTDCELRVAA